MTSIFFRHNNIAECQGPERMQKITQKMAQLMKRAAILQFYRLNFLLCFKMRTIIRDEMHSPSRSAKFSYSNEWPPNAWRLWTNDLASPHLNSRLHSSLPISTLCKWECEREEGGVS